MKFHGTIAFWKGDVEIRPGVWVPQIEEKPYTGDIYKNARSFQTPGEQQNPNLTLTNQISILSDLYLRENFNSIRYVIWNGVKWSVSQVSIEYPRITLQIGGVYHGQEQVGVT